MTLLTRVSSLGLQQGTLGDMMRLQSELGNTQRQITSGKSAGTFKELSAKGQTERVLSFKQQIQKSDDYIRNNTIITNRVQAYNSSVSNMIDVAEQLRNLLVMRRTPTSAESLPFDELTASYFATIKSNLNVEIEGRYIFAGSKTDTRPVENIETKNYTIDSTTSQRVYNSTYYEGDNVQLSSQANDALDMPYGITANHSAFQKIIGAIHLAKEGHSLDNDEILAEAVDLVTATIAELSTVQADINNNITVLDQTNNEHIDFKTFLDQSLSEVTETDIAEATIRLSSIQTTLEASFLAYSKISSLKLTDFLR